MILAIVLILNLFMGFLSSLFEIFVMLPNIFRLFSLWRRAFAVDLWLGALRTFLCLLRAAGRRALWLLLLLASLATGTWWWWARMLLVLTWILALRLGVLADWIALATAVILVSEALLDEGDARGGVCERPREALTCGAEEGHVCSG